MRAQQRHGLLAKGMGYRHCFESFLMPLGAIQWPGLTFTMAWIFSPVLSMAARRCAKAFSFPSRSRSAVSLLSFLPNKGVAEQSCREERRGCSAEPGRGQPQLGVSQKAPCEVPANITSISWVMFCRFIFAIWTRFCRSCRLSLISWMYSMTPGREMSTRAHYGDTLSSVGGRLVLGTKMHKEDPWMAKVGVCTFMVPEQSVLSSGQTDIQGLHLPCQQWPLHWHQPLLHLSQHIHR